MAITLTNTYPEDTIILSGGETFDLSEGKHLKIETSPEGEEYLDTIVPEGKKWVVSISLNIVETYA